MNPSQNYFSNSIVLHFGRLTRGTNNIEQLSGLLVTNAILHPEEIPLMKSSNWSPVVLYSLVYAKFLRETTDPEALKTRFINSLNNSDNSDIAQIFQEPLAVASSGSFEISKKGPNAKVAMQIAPNDYSHSSTYNPNNLQYEKLLGLGAFGAVVSALDKLTGKAYAVKIIQINFTHQHKLAINEATILQQVSRSKDFFVKYHHHWKDLNISDVLIALKDESISEIGQNFRILMDMYPKSLRQWITESRDSANYLTDVREFFNQVIQGIAYLHGRMPIVLHRDLKPANIMLQRVGDSRYEAKIGDFGLSKESSGLDESLKTAGLGTRWYQSPEQLKTRVYGPPADMYSLGKILYEMHSPPRAEELNSFDSYVKRLDKEDDDTFLQQYPLQGLVYRMLTRQLPADRLEAKSLFVILKIDQMDTTENCLDNSEVQSPNLWIYYAPDEPKADQMHLFKLLEYGTNHTLNRIELHDCTVDPQEFISGLQLHASCLRELHLDKIVFNNTIKNGPFSHRKLILPHLVEFYLSCDFSLPGSMMHSSNYSSHHHTLSVIQDHSKFMESLLFFQSENDIPNGLNNAPLLKCNIHLIYKNVTVVQLSHRDKGKSSRNELVLPHLRFLKREQLIEQMGPPLDELHINGDDLELDVFAAPLKNVTLLRVDITEKLLQSLVSMKTLEELRIHFAKNQELNFLSTFPQNLKLLCVRNATFTDTPDSDSSPVSINPTTFTQLSQIVFDNCELSNLENLLVLGGLENSLEKLYVRAGLSSNPSETLLQTLLTGLDSRPFNFLFVQFNKNCADGITANASWSLANDFIGREFKKELPLGDNFIFERETQGSRNHSPLHVSFTNMSEVEVTKTMYELFNEPKFEVERNVEDIMQENKTLDKPKLWGFGMR